MMIYKFIFSHFEKNILMTLSNNRLTESFSLHSISRYIFIFFSSVASTGKSLQISTWTSIAFVVDKPSRQVTLYINGKVAYDNSSFVVSKSHILNKNDLIGFYGGRDIFIFLFFVIIWFSSYFYVTLIQT